MRCYNDKCGNYDKSDEQYCVYYYANELHTCDDFVNSPQNQEIIDRLDRIERKLHIDKFGKGRIIIGWTPELQRDLEHIHGPTFAKSTLKSMIIGEAISQFEINYDGIDEDVQEIYKIFQNSNVDKDIL